MRRQQVDQLPSLRQENSQLREELQAALRQRAGPHDGTAAGLQAGIAGQAATRP
jgi:hypothetical protein